MAKRFKGFTPQQTATLLQKMGYSGPADTKSMDAFVAANPAAAARLGKYTEAASRKVAGEVAAMSMPPASKIRAFVDGGVVTSTTEEDKAKQAAMKEGQKDLMVGAYTDPTSIVTPVETGKIATDATQNIAEGTGTVAATTPVTATTATAQQAETTAPKEAATVTTATSTPAVTSAVEDVKAVTGTVSDQAKTEAVTKDPATMAQLSVDAAQIEKAQTVQAPEARALQAGEAIEGSAVDMQKVADATNIVAAQAEPTKAATVQGQLETLMTSFEGGQTPAWAAGAMRNATAALAARGLGASSMAGQAIIQATMESALPIAMADAQTRASFEAQNLSNRQQAAMLGAEQRARFLEMDFDQAFQTRVANAAKISDIANQNFTAEQQIALENARLAQSVDLENLGARNAKILSDAAAMSNMDMTNLNNRQQAAVVNAQAFLQMDMANLSAEQQTAMFKAQSIVTSLFNDTAAENVSRQINASSQNQVTQFYDTLAANTSQFNVAQTNAMSQFNADATTAVSKFNAEMEQQRNVFNAEQSVAISQFNAKWRQDVTTTEYAAEHEANMANAAAATGLTAEALGQLWQRESDLMDYAFRASEGEKDRAAQIAALKLTAAEEANLQADIAKGGLMANAVSGLFGLW